MPWWGWVLVGWAALAQAGGVLLGRAIRQAQRNDSVPSVPEAGRERGPLDP